MVLLGSVGCAKSVQSQEQVHKGVLENVDRKAYGNQWVVLEFKHGMTADIRTAGQSKFYMGHYQEITVDSQGNFLSNRCDSYDKMAEDLEKYVPSQESPEVEAE
jgi:hypothetical protein